MSDVSKIVRFYLHKQLLRRYNAGRHNFLNKVTEVLKQAGFEVKACADDLAAMIAASTRSEYSMVLMEQPVNELGVTFRQNYLAPFWHIERQSERWEWPVARAAFDIGIVPWDDADRFARFRRRKLFGTPAPRPTTGYGYIYMPLQGRLLVQRSFQTCSPLDMIRITLEHMPDRDVIVSLHPKENYTDTERTELDQLIESSPRLQLSLTPMSTILPGCDLVVTQNSSVALHGFFLHKRAVLFGRSDFHHIAENVADLGAKDAFQALAEPDPDFDSYLWWFFHGMSINAIAADVESQIRDRLRRAGWPV